LSLSADVEILTLRKQAKCYDMSEEGQRGGVTHRFVVVCIGATAVSPNVVYSDNHREHGKENRAERGGLRKSGNVLHGKGRERSWLILSNSRGT